VRLIILLALSAIGFISTLSVRHFELPESHALEDPAGPPWPQIPQGLSRSLAIQARDVVAVRVAGEDDLSGEFPVADNGSIELPMGGPVTVAGLDTRDAARRVAAVLAAGFLVHPDVTMTRVRSEYQSVFVIGHVQRPGVVSTSEELSLGRLLTLAGGATSAAGSSVLVMRPAAPSMQPTALDDPTAHAFMFDLAGDTGALLRDGDTIYVRAGGQIAVTGGVLNPGLYTFEPGMTVAVAVARAGGPHEGASTKRTQISRFVNGERRAIDVDLAVVLAPGDIVIVRGRRLFF
jgi:protein involved in polysaccharide export with SLBB domain